MPHRTKVCHAIPKNLVMRLACHCCTQFQINKLFGNVDISALLPQTPIVAS